MVCRAGVACAGETRSAMDTTPMASNHTSDIIHHARNVATMHGKQGGGGVFACLVAGMAGTGVPGML